MEIISNARKLILKSLDGPVVNFPPDVTVSEYGANNASPTVVVFNATDPSWQGAGTEDFVIINEVPGEIAENALGIYETSGLYATLYFLMASGFGDQYTTNQAFVESKLSPAGRMLDDGSGLMKRDDRDLVDLWKSGDTFFVSHGNDKRRIEPDILLRTYRNADGSAIVLETVPETD